MKIDGHQHFWQFDPVRDAWIDEKSMSIIRRDFLPEDLLPVLKKTGCMDVLQFRLINLKKRHCFYWIWLKKITLYKVWWAG